MSNTSRRVAAEGLTAFRAAERLQGGIHPLDRDGSPSAVPDWEVRTRGLRVDEGSRGEVRVRQLGGFPDHLIGHDLMNQAFGPSGRLTDQSVARGEQEGTRALFAGAYAVLRNPAGHREVNYDDVSEAADAVQTAMRILDRIESRRSQSAGNSGP